MVQGVHTPSFQPLHPETMLFSQSSSAGPFLTHVPPASESTSIQGWLAKGNLPTFAENAREMTGLWSENGVFFRQHLTVRFTHLSQLLRLTMHPAFQKFAGVLSSPD